MTDPLDRLLGGRPPQQIRPTIVPKPAVTKSVKILYRRLHMVPTLKRPFRDRWSWLLCAVLNLAIAVMNSLLTAEFHLSGRDPDLITVIGLWTALFASWWCLTKFGCSFLPGPRPERWCAWCRKVHRW